MGNKKSCSCGFWNEAQQECLYSGYGCAKDEQNKVKVPEEFIKDKITELFVIFNILKPSSNDVSNADTFVRSLISVA